LPFQLSLTNLACEREERLLFSGVNATYGAGDIVQVAGPNGVGKTTLLKMIVGRLMPAQGRIDWTPIQRCDEPPSLYESLLYIGHQPAVKASLTALENLQWYFGLNGVKSINDVSSPSLADYEKALDKVGLSGYEHVECCQMSAGQQRRVALARLFLSFAPLWILDEPFTAIDTRGVQALETQIQQHAERGGIVLLTTHQTLAIQTVKILDLAHFLPENPRVGGEKPLMTGPLND